MTMSCRPAPSTAPARGSCDMRASRSALPGFGLRIKPTGIRSYIVQYRTRDTGQSKRMTIGQLMMIPLEP